MQRYKEQSQEYLEVRCNQCGREIAVQGNILQEDLLHVEKNWGYFSRKDATKHRWDLCENCYDILIRGFTIPVEELDMTELL